jgi:hypothetical protein
LLGSRRDLRMNLTKATVASIQSFPPLLEAFAFR